METMANTFTAYGKIMQIEEYRALLFLFDAYSKKNFPLLINADKNALEKFFPGDYVGVHGEMLSPVIGNNRILYPRQSDIHFSSCLL